MPTATKYPVSYDTTDYSYASVNSSYPLQNAVEKPATNTTYAQWSLKTGSNAESWVYYNFDCSDIPANATIESVTCSAKAYISSTTSSYVSQRWMNLYSGTTAKGTQTSYSTSTSTVWTIPSGTWTREELQNCRLRIYAKRGTLRTTTTYNCRFYGATLTVKYSVPAVPPTITIGTQNKSKISDETGNNACTVTFTADMNLTKWEARALKGSTVPERGQGLLVEDGESLTTGQSATVEVLDSELTNGDGGYTVAVYGLAENGYWSDGTYEAPPAQYVTEGSYTPSSNMSSITISSLGFAPKGGIIFYTLAQNAGTSADFYTFLSSDKGVLYDNSTAGFVWDGTKQATLGADFVTFIASSRNFRRAASYTYVIWG